MLELAIAFHRACAARGLKINFGQGKTELMAITKRAEELTVNITMERRHITEIEKYKYLGFMVSKDGKCVTELLKRIGMAKTTFNNMRKILSSMNITMELLMRLVKCLVWSVLM